MPVQWPSRCWRRLCATAAVAMPTVAILGCPLTQQDVASFGCPEHAINIAVFDTVVTSIPLAAETAAIPEYHDCQRMLVGKSFGPLIAIWAAQDLATIFSPLRAGDHDTMAYAVAQIVNLGNGPKGPSGPEDYAPLSLEPGFSCLYLWRSQAPDSLRARIVHLSDKAALHRCIGARPLDREFLDQHPLSVHVIRDSLPAADSVPPVARWDQDPVGHAQYIGLRCADAWCEIGPAAGFTSSRPVIAELDAAKLIDAAYESDDAYPVSDSRWPEMQQVKGWYDQQELEVWEAGKLVPSGVVGTIIPNPVLDVIGSSAMATGPKFYHRWVPSAYIHVTGTYKGKQLQLEQGVSRLYLCKGFFGDCPGVTLTTSDADSMWSMMVGPSGDTTYHSVEYNEHGGSVIPAGAARWRWLETDGTLWTRCEAGCCTNR